MKTKTALARLLGEVVAQRDAARHDLRRAEDDLAALEERLHNASALLAATMRDYSLHVLRDAHGGDWTWAAPNVARRVRDDMGEDQVELRPDGDHWRVVWYYHPCKPRRADGAKVKELGRSYPKPTAGEALLDLMRRGIACVEGDDESA